MSYDGTGHHVPKKMRFQLDAYCFLLYNIYTVKERKKKKKLGEVSKNSTTISRSTCKDLNFMI